MNNHHVRDSLESQLVHPLQLLRGIENHAYFITYLVIEDFELLGNNH
jgi:hypothetical protein